MSLSGRNSTTWQRDTIVGSTRSSLSVTRRNTTYDGRLLDALEQLVGGRGVQVLDLGDDPDAAGGRERLEAEVGDDRLDLLDADQVALALEHVEVGVHAVAGAGALGAGAAAAAGR